MPRTFDLTTRIAGIAVNSAEEGDPVQYIIREALTSLNGKMITWRLEELHDAIFSHIPDFPLPWQIDHLLVIIPPDLRATAYVNELNPVAMIRSKQPVQAGDPIYVRDILDLRSYDLGVSIPPDCALVFIKSYGWRRALFYDFEPLGPEAHERNYDLSTVLAKQTLSLLMGKFGLRPPSVTLVQQALAGLEGLLHDCCKQESRYQELLERYPWLLGGQHTLIERHTSLDGSNIPDFTGVRARDGARDIFEIKQPFLSCFRRDGHFTQSFNDAWQQIERYLTFVRNNRGYLHSERGLVFSNPHGYLLVGWQLSDCQLRSFHDREVNAPSITLLTYNQVLRLGQALLELVERAAGPEIETLTQAPA